MQKLYTITAQSGMISRLSKSKLDLSAAMATDIAEEIKKPKAEKKKEEKKKEEKPKKPARMDDSSSEEDIKKTKKVNTAEPPPTKDENLIEDLLGMDSGPTIDSSGLNQIDFGGN